MRRFILSLVAALALSTPALAQGTTTINNLPAANTPLYCSEVVASWQVYRTVKIPVALAGAVCQAATAPLSPFAGQQWWDTSAGGGLWSLRVYDGASWLPIGRLDTTAHVWTPATNQPVQTVTGAGKIFTASDFQFDTRRSNSASAMTDTFPALAAGVNGARITVTNADASAGDTITAASGTTICGANSCGTTTVVPAGRSLAFVFDSANTAWRPSANTATAVLGPTSTASGNLAAFTDTTGKVLTDSGVLPANVVQGPGSATSGNLASYNGTSGKLLADASVAVNQVVTLTGSQTLTNKTLTAPVIGTIVNTGTLTLPTSTDTIVGRATTDTLTNKTLTAPVMTTPTLGVASGTSLALGGATLGTNVLAMAGKQTNTLTTSQLRLAYDGSNYMDFTVGSTGGLTLSGAGGGSASVVAIGGALAGGVSVGYYNSNVMAFPSTGVVALTSGAVNGTKDTGFSRDSVLGAGNVDLGNGTANNKSGTLNLANITMTGTLTTGVTGGGTQCAQVSNTGVLSGSGAGCASAAPSAMMHLVSGDTIASNNTFVNITFDAIDFDTAGICSAVSHVCTPTTAGKYRVTCRTQLTAAGTVANGDHLSGVTARKNGASAPGMNFTAYASASGTGSLSEGEVNGIVTVNGSTDTIGCAANVGYTSFSSGTILGGGDNYLIISYVGP